jgi:flagellar basal-body rod modification protein FlgD
MTPLPISSIAAYSSAAATPATTPGPATSAPSKATNLASQDVFLQLLVAQLKNQDPSQPTDGTAFVTQLAQFTTLQEETQSRTDLDKIVASLPSNTPPVTS